MTQFARLAVMAIGTGVGGGLLTGGALSLLIILILDSDTVKKQRAACDRIVATMFATDSLVELERAKFLIGKLDCSVKRRLPEINGGT